MYLSESPKNIFQTFGGKNLIKGSADILINKQHIDESIDVYQN